jgi:hypothetical protein
VPHQPEAAEQLLGLLIAFGAIPRIVAGPVLLVIEAATFLLVRGRVTRAPGCGDAEDIVPLGMFAWRLAKRL